MQILIQKARDTGPVILLPNELPGYTDDAWAPLVGSLQGLPWRPFSLLQIPPVLKASEWVHPYFTFFLLCHSEDQGKAFPWSIY